MLRKSFIRPALFVFAALILLSSTSLYSQTSKISYRISMGFAHVSLDEFWQSRYGDNWSQGGNFKDHYFKPQAGLNIRYELTPAHSLVFGAEFSKVSDGPIVTITCDPVGCPEFRSIIRNNFYFIPFNAGYEYSIQTEPENIIPFIGLGFVYTIGRISEIHSDNFSDDRDEFKINDSVYGLYLTLGFKRKLTDKLGLLVMGKYRNSDTIFGEWNNRDVLLNLSGFNLGMAVEWSR